MIALDEKLHELTLIKRDGKRRSFEEGKIALAIKKGFDGVENTEYTIKDSDKIYEAVLKEITKKYEDKKSIKIEDIQDLIEETLKNFNIDAEVLTVSDGPTVSRYEIKLAEGIKVNKIVSLADNLAMSLAAIDVRIEAPIPGKSAIGVEVPKAIPSMVTLREIIEDPGFQKSKGALTFALGKDVAGSAVAVTFLCHTTVISAESVPARDAATSGEMSGMSVWPST